MSQFERYSESRVVSANELDQLGHMNNVIYLKWVQEIAENHWKRNATSGMLQSYVWVVLSHRINYHKPALLGNELTLTTYVDDAVGPRSVRHVQFFRKEMLIADSSTEWCLLDSNTMRPLRVTPSIMNVFLADGLENG